MWKNCKEIKIVKKWGGRVSNNYSKLSQIMQKNWSRNICVLVHELRD